MLGGGRQRSRGAGVQRRVQIPSSYPLCPSALGANHHAKFPWRTTTSMMATIRDSFAPALWADRLSARIP
jgi:hypothetical protein